VQKKAEGTAATIELQIPRITRILDSEFWIPVQPSCSSCPSW